MNDDLARDLFRLVSRRLEAEGLKSLDPEVLSLLASMIAAHACLYAEVARLYDIGRKLDDG